MFLLCRIEKKVQPSCAERRGVSKCKHRQKHLRCTFHLKTRDLEPVIRSFWFEPLELSWWIQCKRPHNPYKPTMYDIHNGITFRNLSLPFSCFCVARGEARCRFVHVLRLFDQRVGQHVSMPAPTWFLRQPALCTSLSPELGYCFIAWRLGGFHCFFALDSEYSVIS